MQGTFVLFDESHHCLPDLSSVKLLYAPFFFIKTFSRVGKVPSDFRRNHWLLLPERSIQPCLHVGTSNRVSTLLDSVSELGGLFCLAMVVSLLRKEAL